jgi:uncharacterized protein (TIGR03086 family)
MGGHVDNQNQINDPIAQLKEANAVFTDVLANVTPEQMPLPTVNDEWDVRALINHLVAGNQWMARSLTTADVPRPSGDAIGDRSPADAYAESWNALIAAFEEPGALERTMTMPFGEVPATMLAALRFSDTVAHAWDLAQATGQNTDLAPDLCEVALAITRQRLAGRDRAQLPFKEEVPVPADACAADRLAGYMGKPVRVG